MFILLLVIILLFIICLVFLRDYFLYSSEIKIQLPFFTKIEKKDTHGGFHGDGETFLKVTLSPKQTKKFAKEIKESSYWKKMPIPVELQEKLLNPLDKDIKIPLAKKGYWFFLDRYNESVDKYNYMVSFSKSSLNFTIAIFNTDSNTLYIYELDT